MSKSNRISHEHAIGRNSSWWIPPAPAVTDRRDRRGRSRRSAGKRRALLRRCETADFHSTSYAD